MSNQSNPARAIAQKQRHELVVPSDTDDLKTRYDAIYCEGAGTVVIRDVGGTDLSYTLIQGQVLPFDGIRILATGTTATLYGWF